MKKKNKKKKSKIRKRKKIKTIKKKQKKKLKPKVRLLKKKRLVKKTKKHKKPLARLKSIKPGLITMILPIKPTITAAHLLKPTFSFNKKGDNAVVINGATKASVKAFAIEIIDIE